MTQTGAKTKIYIGIEDVEGVLAATLIPIEVETANENDKVTPAERKGSKGNIAETHGSEIVEQLSEVEISGDLPDQILGIILLAIYGQISSDNDNPEAGVSTHTASVKNNNNHPTFSVVFADPDVNAGSGEFRACLGCQLNTGEFSIDKGAFGKYSTQFMGRSSETTTDPNTDYLDENFFTTPTAKFLLANNVAGLDAANPLCLQSGKLSFNKNAQTQFCIGQGVNPVKCYNGRMSAKIEATVIYEDKTYIDLERNNTVKSARIELESGATIGASTNPKISFTFGKCKIRELTRDRNIEDQLRQSFGIIPEDIINDTAVLINAKDSYIAD